MRTHESSNFAHPSGRNMRTVWRFPTQPYPGAHFAVFPPELPRRCILAGTPPKACAVCGAPWERIIEREEEGQTCDERAARHKTADMGRGGKRLPPEPGQPNAFYAWRTIGWQPTCECCGSPDMRVIRCQACVGSGQAEDGEPCLACGGDGVREERAWPEGVLNRWPTRPAIVLDPFAGSGTTLMVAEELGRGWIGIDICEDYLPQIQQRTAQRSLAAAFENDEWR